MTKKWAVVYSSVTGNTRRIAEAMAEALPEGTELHRAKESPKLDDFDAVVVGYWVTRGGPCPEAMEFLPTMRNRRVVLFQTLGADPVSEHSVTSLARAAYALGEGCEILGTFACRGKIRPELLEKRRGLPEDHPHACSEANLKRWAAAASHPDSADLDKARAFMDNIQRKLVMLEQRASRG